MNSFQQVILGAVCVGGAFWFGNYLNHHPNPDDVANAIANTASLPPLESKTSLLSPGSPVGQLPSFQVQSKPESLPSKRELPPPSQLEPASKDKNDKKDKKDKNDNQSNGHERGTDLGRAADSQIVNKPPRREIVLPDFSELAANFRNTPLELPPMVSSAQSKQTSSQPDLHEKPPAFPTSDVAPAPPLKDPAVNNFPLVVDRPAIHAPDRPAIQDTNFPPDPTRQIEIVPAKKSMTGDALRELPSVKDVTVSQFSELPTAADHVVSKYDLAPESIQVAKPMLPFGLTDAEKSKLVQLRRPVDRQIKLGTTKFIDYVTEPNDTLPELSRKYYGVPDFYLDIYMANQNVLKNPAEVPPGLSLKIPVYE